MYKKKYTYSTGVFAKVPFAMYVAMYVGNILYIMLLNENLLAGLGEHGIPAYI